MNIDSITIHQFIKFCQENNLEGVRHCLSRGVDVNTVSENGCHSALTIAIDKKYTELLEILLSHPDIKINNTTKWLEIGISGDWNQWTALMVACSCFYDNSANECIN